MYKRAEYQLIKKRIEVPKMFKPQAAFIVGDGGIGAEGFLSMDLRKLF